ncbi:hypothetical protein [Nitratifractor sp.]
MFSNKLAFALGAVMIFLAFVAFIVGRPAPRDKRIYPIVRKYEPFVIEKTLGGLRILRKDDPTFKEEPAAVDFYPRLQALERQWAAEHLRLQGDRLLILEHNRTVDTVRLRNDSERRFVRDYYGVDR